MEGEHPVLGACPSFRHKKKIRSFKISKDQSAVYDILAFNFAGQDTAKETIKEIHSSGVLEGYKIAAQAIMAACA